MSKEKKDSIAKAIDSADKLDSVVVIRRLHLSEYAKALNASDEQHRAGMRLLEWFRDWQLTERDLLKLPAVQAAINEAVTRKTASYRLQLVKLSRELAQHRADREGIE